MSSAHEFSDVNLDSPSPAETDSGHDASSLKGGQSTTNYDVGGLKAEMHENGEPEPAAASEPASGDAGRPSAETTVNGVEGKGDSNDAEESQSQEESEKKAPVKPAPKPREQMSEEDLVAEICGKLVDGIFNIDTKFVISSATNIVEMVELLDKCSVAVQAELWSIFTAILRKSNRNLELCSDVGLICLILDRLAAADRIVAELFIELLGILANYSISVRETKRFLRALKASAGRWPRYSSKLLHVLKQMSKRDGPGVFFSFSGTKGSGIALPPIKTWPYQQGWTFCTWFRLDPRNSVRFEQERPYLFCFRSAKGIGYSAHFVGACLVITAAKTQTKGYQHCVKFEFSPRRWYMVAMAFVYSTWGKSEFRCYVDGQLVDAVEMPWNIAQHDHYDRCFIGSSPDGSSDMCLSGQMAAIYLFAETLSMQEINSIFCLGPSYQSQFKYPNEIPVPEGYKKYLFGGKLSSALAFHYCPKNCDRSLCLESSPKNSKSIFVHTPHAMMQNDVKVVTTHSIDSSLHSVGGIQVLLPLFAQLDALHEMPEGSLARDPKACSLLVDVLWQLLETNSNFQQEMLHSKGLCYVSHMLQSSAAENVTEEILNAFIGATKFLSASTTGVSLLKHVFDFVLFNPGLWVRADAKTQVKLYHYLATDFLTNESLYSHVRPVSTVLQMVHGLKYYYWLVNPAAKSGFTAKGTDDPRPENMDIARIRSWILAFVSKTMLRAEDQVDEELQVIFNFLATVNEDDNLYDILQMLINLMAEKPSTLVPAFHRKNGISVVYRLLLHAAHLSMATYNALFEILTEEMTHGIIYQKHATPEPQWRFENPMILKVVANLISQSKPSTELLEVKEVFLTDLISMCAHCKDNRRTILQMSVWQEWLVSLAYIFPDGDVEGQITNLVHQLFAMLLHHAIKLEYGGWRVWVDTLAIVHSKVSFELFRSEMAKKYNIYRKERSLDDKSPGMRSPLPAVLGGPYNSEEGPSLEEEVHSVMRNLVERVAMNVGAQVDQGVTLRPQSNEPRPKAAASKPPFKGEPQRPIYRTPEFRWSHVHLRLLSDVLSAIEDDVQAWKMDKEKTMIEIVNSPENSVFVVNTVHLISQLVDNLIMSCGGLLPLLAAATSPNNELEITDGTSQGLPISVAVLFLLRFVSLVDVFVFGSSANFGDLEREKNMPPGGILRQCLRLVSSLAVRNCLAAQAQRSSEKQKRRTSTSSSAIFNLIRSADQQQPTGASQMSKDEEIEQAISQSILAIEPEHLLQEMDLSRIKAVVYRDMEETKHAQFLALAVVYFLSVLMVSRYRDILEPSPSSSPFFDTGRDSRRDRDAGGADDGTVRDSGSQRSDEASVDGQQQSEAGGDGEQDQPEEEGASKDDASSQDASEQEPDEEEQPISSIQIEEKEQSTLTSQPSVDAYKPDDLTINTSPMTPSGHDERQLTEKLEKALSTTAPLLREIMSDFQGYLQRTLLGTHGQEIMNDSKVVRAMCNPRGSVIELVMLLCSQEWQTSLQKHAGLAFIELVNEGRLLAHATREHLVRVANEADFILNRLRAEDVSKHADFEAMSAQVTADRKQEEKTCDHLITSARRRNGVLAKRINEKILNIITAEHGAWAEENAKSDASKTFWKLDIWEDDSRRRKRLIPNPLGSTHPEATPARLDVKVAELGSQEASDEVLRKLALAAKISPPTKSSTSAPTNDEMVEDSDLAKLGEDGKDLEPSFSEPATYTTPCKLLSQGVVVPGILSLTNSEMFFDCNDDDPEFKRQDPRVLRYCDYLHGRWHFSEIRAIFLRRYLLQSTAIEIFMSSRSATMLAFADHPTVKKVIAHLPRVGVGVKYGVPQSRNASLMSARQLFKHSDMSQKWQRREISNFDYIMFLNTVAGRSYNDLNQYPVFPWILSNYESETLDLNQASNFRDLSKPVGSLDVNRQTYFQEKFDNWEDDKIPPFHYGTHYSTGAFVMNWMLRVEPFTSMFLALQGGKFDNPDRTFHSFDRAWKNCQRDTNDVKELIPELYYLPEMFENRNGYRFGDPKIDSGGGNVALPPWAKTPEHFVSMHRMALETDLVSCQLHQWIDLIFGYKQRGPEAVRATNVFYYLTYEGALDLAQIEDATTRRAVEDQIRHFGQTPSQLLSEPHPPRQSVLAVSPMAFSPVSDEVAQRLKLPSNSPVVHVSANTFPQLAHPCVLSISSSLGFALNPWNNSTLASAGGSAPMFESKESGPPATPTTPGHPTLPLQLDSALRSSQSAVPPAARHLGDALDQRLTIRSNNFVCTTDSKFVVTCGYPDYSFRVLSTDDSKVIQVVYGHTGTVTCLARSECNIVSDCYIASGSTDCVVLLWHWNSKHTCVAGEYNAPGEVATPRAVLTGHDDVITAIVISAEQGLILSAARDGCVLAHTSQGDLLRSLEWTHGDVPKPLDRAVNANGTMASNGIESDSNVATNGKAIMRTPVDVYMSRECHVVILYDYKDLVVFSASGLQLASCEGEESVECMCLSRDGEYLLTAGSTGVVRIRRVIDLALLHVFKPLESSIKSIALSHSHRHVLCGLQNGSIVVLNVDFNRWHQDYVARYK